jgi:hypothetical protein
LFFVGFFLLRVAEPADCRKEPIRSAKKKNQEEEEEEEDEEEGEEEGEGEEEDESPKKRSGSRFTRVDTDDDDYVNDMDDIRLRKNSVVGIRGKKDGSSVKRWSGGRRRTSGTIGEENIAEDDHVAELDLSLATTVEGYHFFSLLFCSRLTFEKKKTCKAHGESFLRQVSQGGDA